MTQTSWSPSPPQYLRRWAVQGVKPNGDRATTIFDLRKDRHHVAIYPATVDTFAILIDHAAVQTLLTTIESRNACTVPGMHAEPPWPNRPADTPSYQGPVELYVHLPNQQIHIIYGNQGLITLHDALTKILTTCANSTTPQPSPEHPSSALVRPESGVIVGQTPLPRLGPPPRPLVRRKCQDGEAVGSPATSAAASIRLS